MIENRAREPAFAAKFVKALYVGQVSGRYGQAACILLATLAGIEEGIQGNPEFIERHLIPLSGECGFGSKKTLLTAIKRLRESGWLEYVPGSNYEACRFRVEIPDDVRVAMGLRCKNYPATEPQRNRNGGAYIPTPTPTPNNPLPPSPADQKPNGKSDHNGQVRDQVDQVWAAYLAHHPKAVLDPARRKLITQRLKDGYTVDRLRAAIDGNHRDPHCCGKNDRNREYHDFGLILRNADHIDKYAAVVETDYRCPEPEDPFP